MSGFDPLVSVSQGRALNILFQGRALEQEKNKKKFRVGAKHSDSKFTVSAIGYCPNASPLQALWV
ncbi:MAG: hypothetical protein IM477_08810 [Microcystis sp. M090S1]|nr:hypothetical protein [Microcystis sp. M090S1]